MTTDTDSLQVMLGLDDPTERKLALKSKCVTPWHLRLALQDEDPEVRLQAALHPALTKELMLEVLSGSDRWLAEQVLGRPDVPPHALDAALAHPDLHDAILEHPLATEEHRTAILPELAKNDLSKNIGYVTFPLLDADPLRHHGVFFPKHYSKYVGGFMGRNPKKEEGGLNIATQFVHEGELPASKQKMILLGRRTRPNELESVPKGGEGIRTRMFGEMPEQRIEQLKVVPKQMPAVRRVAAGKILHGNEGHEVQHSVFARLGQKFGGAVRKRIAKKLMYSLPEEHQTVLLGAFHPFSRAYGILEHPEEAIAFAHNYLNDPAHRAKTHVALGLSQDLQAQQNLHNKMKAAWRAVKQAATKLGPDDIGLAKSDLVAVGKTILQKRSTSQENLEDHLGYSATKNKLFAAAEFLSGKKVDPAIFRARKIETEDDVLAVLAAVGLTPEDKPSLLGVVSVLKSAQELPRKAVPLVQSATETAQTIQWAIDNGKVEHVKLGGKHSAGTFLAKDQDENLYLLKPGDTSNSPAKGVSDEPASQSRREAAFYEIAKALGIIEVPSAELISLDGKETAVIRMLGLEYTGLARATEKDKDLPRRVLGPYLDSGKLYEWAFLDYVLGSVDRHGNNMMVSDEGKIALIDHGSSFAGQHFDPGNDHNSFVPFYLRVWGPDKGWQKMSKEDRLKVLPHLAPSVDAELVGWIDGVSSQEIRDHLVKYGINPGPSIARLKKLREVISATGSPSMALNRLWVM